MKKNLISLLTLMLFVCSFSRAQNPSNDCKLKADFALKQENCTIGFIDKSTVATGSTIINWFWSFGDGSIDSSQSPKHVYKHSGKYMVCLTVIAKNGAGKPCKENKCETVNVKDCGNGNDSTKCRLSAKFEFKVDSCTVAFTDNSSAFNGSTITGWYWTFGDGSVDSLKKNPVHAYAKSGVYNVCLTITGKNAAGEVCKDKQCNTVVVKGCNIVIDSSRCKLAAMFKTSTDSCTVKFTNASTTGTGTIITKWYWSFGDGSVDSVNQNPTHAYDFSGNYQVCLTVIGKSLSGKECKDKECRIVNIKGCAQDTTQCRLNAKFTSKTDSCTVKFTDNSTASAGTSIIKRYWSFGDGTVDSTNANPSHAYAHDGVYNVCLNIVGKNASSGKICKDKECHTVFVKGCAIAIDSSRCKLAAMFKTKTDSCTVSFTNASSAGTGTTITKRYWSFGDGSVDSTSQNPKHEYAYSGHYQVCLTIVGKSLSGKLCKDKECRVIDIKGCGEDTTQCRLNAKFKSSTDSCKVTFTDNTTTSAGTTVIKRYWSFGDGSVVDSTNQNPTHEYAFSGYYNVCLTVIAKNANSGKVCKDRECKYIFIKGCGIDTTICRLNAKFDYEKDSTKVTFDDQSKTTGATTIKKWYWSFGDGTTDSVENPVHVYAKPDKYKVCLTVVGVNAGKECKDVSCEMITAGHHKDAEILTDAASSVSMLQLYPNPATDVLNINFKVEVAGQVNINITDIQGRVISVVQDAYMTTGFHNVSWNVNANPGLYLLTIKTNAGVEQKQVLLQPH